MKKRVLLTIMILFSINVNSVSPECKLPDIKFFEMIEEEGVQKFNFHPFAEQISSDLSKSTTGDIEYLGVKFAKNMALGAQLKVYELFVDKLIENAGSASIPLENFIVGGYTKTEEILESCQVQKNALLSAYDAKLKPIDNENLERKIRGKSDLKGIVDYLVKQTEAKPNWVASWFVSGTKYFTPINADALNASLNYIYLFALRFLITDKKDLSKYLDCMYTLSEDISEQLDKAGIDAKVLQIFDAIQMESGMEEKIKPLPLSLEQSRTSLNILSSTLSSLANLKFI